WLWIAVSSPAMTMDGSTTARQLSSHRTNSPQEEKLHNSASSRRRRLARARVLGATGPTGPFVVNGPTAQAYRVSILHRGTHDSDAIPRHVERIVGDPHFVESLEAAIGDRTFDLIVATYGRIRHVAEVVAGRTGRLITVGGQPCYK